MTPGDTMKAPAKPARPRGGDAATRRAGGAIDWFVPCIGALALLALLVRLPTFASRSVWMDEAYSFWFSNLTWTQLWSETPFYETHPPLYYSLLKAWTMFAGTSEAGMRSLSLLASVATVVVIAYSPRLLTSDRRYDRVGLLAAALFALNQGSIEYAQQARPYALIALTCTLMIVCSLLLLRYMLVADRPSPVIPGAVPLSLLLGATAGVTLWLHNTNPFIILGNWLALFATIFLYSPYRRRDLLTAAGALVVALLIWAPCIPILLIESRTVASSFWVTISPKMLTWPLTLAAGGKFAFVPAIVLALFGWRWLHRKHPPFGLYAPCVLLVPLAGIFIVSYLFKPVFVTRTFEWMAPPFLALVALGALAPGRRAGLRRAAIPLLLILCVAQDIKYFRTPTQDLRGIVNELVSQYQPGDLVLVYPNELEVGLQYYLVQKPLQMDLVALPAPYPAVGLERPYLQSNRGVPAVLESDRPRIAQLLAAHGRVWLVGAWPAHDSKLDVVSSEMLRERGAPVSSKDFVGTQLTRFAAPHPPPAGSR